jgi:adenylate kinase
MIVVVGGVPGAGKTAVITRARELEDFDYVNYGDLFFQLAKERYGIKHRDEMRRKLSIHEYRELHRAVAEEIQKIDMRDLKRPVVVDTHFTIATPVGFYPGFPEYVIDRIPAVAWVLIEGEPEEIRERRQKDASIRQRGGGIEDDIWTHQDLNRSAALLYAYRTNGAVYIIHNRQGHLEEAAQELAEVIRRCKLG